MYQVKVNNDLRFEVEAGKAELKVDGIALKIDQVQLNANSSHILFGNSSYVVELVEVDDIEKVAKVKVNGNLYTVHIEDQFDQLLKQLGMDSLTANKVLQVKAPMPGLVLAVLVQEGTAVKKGDNLLVLEAMKMENMMKSPSDGVIKKIDVAKGDKVEKGQLLISFQ